MSKLKTIRLYGELGKKFGKEFQLDVASPAEAVRLLAANFKDFAPFFVGENKDKKYHILLNEQDLDAEQSFHPSSNKEVIKIIPVVEGTMDNPLVRIVVGLVLIYFFPESPVGYALVLGGVSQLLFPVPNPVNDIEDDANRPSYNFDGPVNTIRQGNPVPVGYGQLRVGSQVVSAGFFSEGLV